MWLFSQNNKNLCQHVEKFLFICVFALVLSACSGVNIHQLNRDNQSKMQEMHEKTNGARTIPQIFIGDTYVGGYQELKALEIAGKLNSLLGI